MLEFWPNSRMPGKLFWQVQDKEANWLRVSQIHAVFSNSAKTLSGFVFEYGNAQVCRQVGHVQGDIASMSLGKDERLTRMDVSTGIGEDEVIVSLSYSTSGINNEPEAKRIVVPHEFKQSLRSFCICQPGTQAQRTFRL
jgi:hypothetical protein